MSKKSVAVRIAGHDYKILSDGDPQSLQQVAKHVDREMARIRDRTGTVDTLDVAVLTCLHLARDVMKLRSQPSAPTSDERMRNLIDRVEALLPSRPVEDGGDASTSEATAAPAEAHTLNLPSVETLSDRMGGASDAGAESDDSSIAPARAAAGGRERAS